MKRSIIRWPGLGAFFAIVGLLVVFSWLFLDTILKWTMEYSLGRLNGAEVNIERVEHRWSPLTLTVHGVQATDPAEPNYNQVQLDKLSADVSASQLLLGRIHIEQLDMLGVRVNQPRESEGEVYVVPGKEDLKNWAKASWDDLQVDLPSTDEIVQRVGLQTEQVVAEAKQKVNEQREVLQQAKENLPDKEKIAQYQERIKALTEGEVGGLGDIAERKKKLDALKEEIRKDKQAISQLREQVSEATEVVKQQVSKVKAAPGNDIDRIQSFFQMNSTGMQNITGLLLGDQAKQWSEYLLLAYEQLAPMLARSGNTETLQKVRGAGESLSFVEEGAPPEFWIKKATTELFVGGTAVNVDWQNITHQHALLGQPTTYQARVDNSQLWKAFNLNGELSLLPEGIDAKQQWQLKGATLDSLGLSNADSLTASIASALLDSDGTVLVRENQLDGEAIVRMLDLKMLAEGNSKLTKAIATALQQLNRLDINSDFGGSIVNPKLSLSSDLDKQLGELLGKTAMAGAQEKLDKIKADLTQKAQQQFGDNADLLNGLSQVNSDSKAFDQQLEELLKAKIEDSLKDKLKGRLFGGL